MSASIADSTARTYDATIAKYVRFSSAKGFDAVRPAVSDCVEFFSHLASESMAAASSVAHAAIKKFIAINGGTATAIDFDAVRAVLQGAANLNLSSRSQRRHRLAMTKASMLVACHVILMKGWAEQDSLMLWTLLLITMWRRTKHAREHHVPQNVDLGLGRVRAGLSARPATTTQSKRRR